MAAFPAFPSPALLAVRPCPDPRFGDYQTTGLMTLAKEQRTNPRQLAAAVVAKLNVADWCEPPEIAGPGFVNFRVKPEAFADQLDQVYHGRQPLYVPASEPRTIVIDFGSPNVAKPLHVGHIRSTILGDCLARTMRTLGHRVVTDNHIGDWGTQFGKVLLGWKRNLNRETLRTDALSEMERLYREIDSECSLNPEVLEAARSELVKLQAGDPENMVIWREMLILSKNQFDAIYRRLGVHFDHTLGESFYNPRLKSVVDKLCQSGLARESQGAQVVFFEDHSQLKHHPAIVQKSDGAANYTTTDLATLEYRIETWKPAEIIYVTDSRQQLHFQQLFEIFRRWFPDQSHVRLSHVWFGSILGENGRPFKTRSGDTIRLAELLDEAEERALRIVTEKNPALPESERREIARVVGLGAIKYADLVPNRQSDYVFNWDKMLALSGNTAPYLQYAYTRIRSIFRKGAAGDETTTLPSPIESRTELAVPAETALCKHLLNFGLVLEAVAEDYRPNYLCNYLFELAGYFTQFYEQCPVLKAPEPARSTRLKLCDLTGRVLKEGLSVLGIETTERM